ncbi:hypothetical protein SmJEL517_g02353 [Synchytrium microbalum]|uniref:Sugar phosphate transporter domain-containing protein n=1 Tax=Synchytrium microbalum TaxID=1806994 RepID=A0A507C815_9FUNG|nr:uncharacterized protein SmJEL517_g02353 [Synchytrium microbalum]TPX35289.1 hypothetical protein SmJEL517_g02353 [Synchytrium microbalum]
MESKLRQATSGLPSGLLTSFMASHGMKLEHFFPSGLNSQRFPKHLPAMVFKASLWIAASAGTVLFNKYLLYELDFPFPLFLTLCQSLLATAGTWALEKLTNRNDEIVLDCKLVVVLPMGLLFSISLMASNMASLHLTATCTAMLKASTPVIAFILGFPFRKDEATGTLLRLLIVIVAVLFVSYKETQWPFVAFIFQVMAVIIEAVRIAISSELMPGRQLPLHFFAPICAGVSGLGFLIFEANNLSMSHINALGIHVLLLNCVVAFLANLEASLIVGKASISLMTASRFVSDVVVIAASTFFWSTSISAIQLFGYGTVLLWGVWYPDRQRVTILIGAMLLLLAVGGILSSRPEVNMNHASEAVIDNINSTPTASLVSLPSFSPLPLPTRKRSTLRLLISGQRLAPPPRINPAASKVLLLGIFSTAEKFGRRQVIRSTYLQHRTSRIDAIFVIGKPKNDVMGAYVALENQLYSDILVLNITENMNEGKTYEYFAAVGRDFEDDEYLYVAKADDDSFILLPRLEYRLDVEGADKRTGAYFGHQWDFYMSGWCYGLSWDLVKWVAHDSHPKANAIGHEDSMTGKWLRDKNKTQHFWPFKKTEFYEPPTVGRNAFKRNVTINNTILLHGLKADLDFITYSRMLLHDIMPPQYRNNSAI